MKLDLFLLDKVKFTSEATEKKIIYQAIVVRFPDIAHSKLDLYPEYKD